MTVELFQNKNGYWEIWVDDKFLKSVDKNKGESTDSYKYRAEQEMDDYVQKQRDLKRGGTTSKKVDI